MVPVTALAPVIELGDDRIFVRALDERERAAAAADFSLQRTMTGLLGVLTLVVAACAPWWPSPIMPVILFGLLLGSLQGVRRAMQRRRELRDGQIVSVCSERRSLHVFAGSGRRVDATAGDTPEAAALVDWTDAWPLCHPGDPGFTVDTEINQMRAAIKPGHKQARIDRVFYRGERWRIAAIERLGMTPCALDPPLPPVFVSDHFGLQVDLAAR